MTDEKKSRKPAAGVQADKPVKPLSTRASVTRVIRRLAKKHPRLFEKAFRDGLKAEPPKSFPYLQLAAYYLDGKPADRVEVEGKALPFLVMLRSKEDPLAAESEEPQGLPFLALPPPEE